MTRSAPVKRLACQTLLHDDRETLIDERDLLMTMGWEPRGEIELKVGTQWGRHGSEPYRKYKLLMCREQKG